MPFGDFGCGCQGRGLNPDMFFRYVFCPPRSSSNLFKLRGELETAFHKQAVRFTDVPADQRLLFLRWRRGLQRPVLLR